MDIKVDKFIDWLQIELNRKYQDSLEGLKTRFKSIFKIIKELIEKSLIFNELGVKAESDNIQPAKLLNENILKILKQIIDEFPKGLNAEYGEKFVQPINSFTSILNHGEILESMDYSEIKNGDRLKDLITLLRKQTDSTFEKLNSLKNRMELSKPMLKHISDSINMFKEPIANLRADIDLLKIDFNKTDEKEENYI